MEYLARILDVIVTDQYLDLGAEILIEAVDHHISNLRRRCNQEEAVDRHVGIPIEAVEARREAVEVLIDAVSPYRH